jgi:hypothetical protein
LCPERQEKAGRGQEREAERAKRDFRAALKMQARSVDPAAETCRKVGHRCRRVKGRIEKQVSTGTEARTRTRATIRSRIKPAAGSKGHTSRRYRMPSLDCACQSGDELFDGSLGTIFIARLLLKATARSGCFQLPLGDHLQREYFLYAARRTALCIYGNWRSCSGRPRTGTAWRPGAAESASSGARDSIVRSRW